MAFVAPAVAAGMSTGEMLALGSLIAPAIPSIVETIKYDIAQPLLGNIPIVGSIFDFERPEIKAQKEQYRQQKELMGEQLKQQKELTEYEIEKQSKMLEKQQELEKKKLEYMPEYLSKVAESEAKSFQTKAKAIGETFQDLRGKYGDVGARTLLGALSYGSGSEGWKSGIDLAQQTQSQYQYQPIISKPLPQVEVPPVQWQPRRSANDSGGSQMMNYLMFKETQKADEERKILQQKVKKGEEFQKMTGEKRVGEALKEIEELKLPKSEKFSMLDKKKQELPDEYKVAFTRSLIENKINENKIPKATEILQGNALNNMAGELIKKLDKENLTTYLPVGSGSNTGQKPKNYYTNIIESNSGNIKEIEETSEYLLNKIGKYADNKFFDNDKYNYKKIGSQEKRLDRLVDGIKLKNSYTQETWDTIQKEFNDGVLFSLSFGKNKEEKGGIKNPISKEMLIKGRRNENEIINDTLKQLQSSEIINNKFDKKLVANKIAELSAKPGSQLQPGEFGQPRQRQPPTN